MEGHGWHLYSQDICVPVINNMSKVTILFMYISLLIIITYVTHFSVLCSDKYWFWLSQYTSTTVKLQKEVNSILSIHFNSLHMSLLISYAAILISMELLTRWVIFIHQVIDNIEIYLVIHILSWYLIPK